MRYSGYIIMVCLWTAALGLGFFFFKQGSLSFLFPFKHNQCNHFMLPLLTYDYKDLEPFIDEQTMRIHHTIHHKKYIDQLNRTVDEHPLICSKPLKFWLSNIAALPAAIRMTILNNGGGHFNHSFYWHCIAIPNTKIPSNEITGIIEKSFGSLEKFKQEFEKSAATVFGSGWTWLCLNKSAHLVIITTANQDTPLAQELEPLLALDLWEHAYYLKHHADRAEYIKAWWNVVNWSYVEKQYQDAQKALFKAS